MPAKGGGVPVSAMRTNDRSLSSTPNLCFNCTSEMNRNIAVSIYLIDGQANITYGFAGYIHQRPALLQIRKLNMG